MDLSGLESDIRKIASRRGSILVRPSSDAQGDYRHGGIMSNTSVDVEPIETPEDENGETRQVGMSISLETRLLQTEATTALPLMKELTSGRTDIVLSPRPVPQDTVSVSVAELDYGEIIFEGRHLKIGANLRYDREESFLPAKVGFRAPMGDIESFIL